MRCLLSACVETLWCFLSFWMSSVDIYLFCISSEKKSSFLIFSEEYTLQIYFIVKWVTDLKYYLFMSFWLVGGLAVGIILWLLPEGKVDVRTVFFVTFSHGKVSPYYRHIHTPIPPPLFSHSQKLRETNCLNFVTHSLVLEGGQPEGWWI